MEEVYERKRRGTHPGRYFYLPGNMAFPDDKVLQLFTKLKRKAKEMESKSPSIPQSPSSLVGESTPIRDLEPNLQELRASAMNSYRLRSDVIKTENGFEVV